MEHLDNLRWRKSSHSGNGGDCVEVGTGLPGEIAVRDSKDRQGPELIVSATAWSQLTEAIKHGEF